MPDIVLVDDLEQLAVRAEQLAAESLSASTRRAYQYDWNRFVTFCAERELEPLGPPGQVALYLAYRVDAGSGVAVLNRALAGICKAFQAAGLPSPRRDPAVALVYSGARRSLGVSVDQVEAILPSNLRVMVERLPTGGSHTLRAVRNRAMLALGWSTGTRRSELVALNVADLAWVPEGLKVTVRRSKTDQEGKGHVIGVPYASNLAVCAVRAVREWLDLAAITDGAVFRAVSPDGMSVVEHRLTDRQFANVIGRAAAQADLPGRYAGHSLRSGLVTTAVRSGKSVSSVMSQTGHRTIEVLMRYVREQQLFADNAAAGLL